MKKRLWLPAVLLAVVLAAIALVRLGRKQANPIRMPEFKESAIGVKENPDARFRYEWAKLANPATKTIPSDMRERELAFARTLPTVETLSKSGTRRSFQSQTWTGRGPYNVGGRTRALGIDVANESMVLAGGVSGGMFRSEDFGLTWTNVTDPAALHSISCLCQDVRPGKTDIWYYGTGEYRGNSAAGGGNAYFHGDGIFKSVDNGVTWTRLLATVSGTPHRFDSLFDYVWNIAVDPSNTSQDVVYAATYGAIFRSFNGGTSWSSVLPSSPSSPYSNYMDVAVTPSGVVYATLNSGGTSAGIWRSPNGINWTAITPASFPSSFRRIVIGIAPSNPDIVYFLAETPGGGLNDHSLWKYTYLSGNGSGSGGSWVDRSSNLPAFGGQVGNFDSQNSYDLVVRVKPDNENAVFVGGTNLYRSTNGFSSSSGTAWIGGYSPLNNVSIYENHFADQHSLAFLPSNPAVMFSGHDGGVSRTDNDLASPVDWISLNNGYITSQFYTVGIDHAATGDSTMVGGMQDNGSYRLASNDSQATWEFVFSGDGSFCAVSDGGQSVYMSCQYGKIYRFVYVHQGGYTGWTRVDPTGGSGYRFLNPFVLDPSNTDRMYLAAGNRLWRNSNLKAIPQFSNSTTGVNWTVLTNSAIFDTISAVMAAKTPVGRVYYGTETGSVYRLDGADTGNPSPVLINGSSFPAGAWVSCIAVDPLDGNRVLVVFSNYEVPSLFYSEDGGSTWADVGGNLEQFPNGSGNGPSARWASFLHANGSLDPVVLVGMSTGLYSAEQMADFSTQWVQEGAAAIGNVIVDMIDVRDTDGLVAAATHGKGIFSTLYTATGVAGGEESQPAGFMLGPNYPNPFNLETRIPFSLDRESVMSLSVYDVRGRLVKTLIRNEKRPAGPHTGQWDGTNDNLHNVGSGVYLYRLTVGATMKTERCVVLK